MKRTFDIMGGVLGLILASPFLIVIAPLVKVTSRGPVFYRQKRTGYGGNPFIIFKFRTMKWDPTAPFVRCTSLQDRRLTKFGKFLKKRKLDELPQFFNVLRGDMSIFGPRPYEVDMDWHFATSVFGYVGRHRVRPGVWSWSKFFAQGNITREVQLDARRYQVFLLGTASTAA